MRRSGSVMCLAERVAGRVSSMTRAHQHIVPWVGSRSLVALILDPALPVCAGSTYMRGKRSSDVSVRRPALGLHTELRQRLAARLQRKKATKTWCVRSRRVRSASAARTH